MVKTFNLTIPRKDNLRYMYCNIVNPGNDPMIRYPHSFRNMLKYRRFLDEIPEAMAVPMKNFQDGVIYVIVANNLFESPTFRDDCLGLDIQIVDQLYPISDSIYKKCLLNTVDHKLLLQWNKVGQFFVERSDFLNSMGSVDAIKLNINYIRDNNAQFHMKAFNLQIPFLKLEARDFQLLYPVNVLPRCARFVRANAIRRWEAIQEEHPFANYEDLREYWRRVHGYTLPVNEEGLLFYDVQFREFTMVYPEICLTSKQNLITSPLKNDAATRIYENFFEDLRRRVTTLCGQELVYPEVNTNCISYNIYQIQSNN